MHGLRGWEQGRVKGLTRKTPGTSQLGQSPLHCTSMSNSFPRGRLALMVTMLRDDSYAVTTAELAVSSQAAPRSSNSSSLYGQIPKSRLICWLAAPPSDLRGPDRSEGPIGVEGHGRAKRAELPAPAS